MRITDNISIPDSEITLTFVRASGPGGQNVNKVSSAVELRFDVARSPSLPPDVRARLRRLAGARLTTEGVLVLQASRHRTQLANRQDALERLADLVRRAAEKPRPRVRTRATAASRRRRLDHKRRRSDVKRLRGRPQE